MSRFSASISFDYAVINILIVYRFDDFLSQVPDERREALARLLETIDESLPEGFEPQEWEELFGGAE